MASNPVADHAQILRVIGQVLELVKAEAHDIVSHGDRFLVRCLTQQGKISSLASILRLWRNGDLPRTETFQGVRKLEEYQLSSFYDSWVQMYIRRKQKSPSGPKS